MPFYDPLSQVYFHLWGSFYKSFHKLSTILFQAGRLKIKTKIKSMVIQGRKKQLKKIINNLKTLMLITNILNIE